MDDLSNQQNSKVQITCGNRRKHNWQTSPTPPQSQDSVNRQNRSLTLPQIGLLLFCVVGIAAFVGIWLWSLRCHHQWSDATCVSPQTCQLCAQTQGEPLGHSPGEWELTHESLVDNTIVRSLFCTICGELLDDQTETISSYVVNGWFYFNDDLFLERFLSILEENSGQKFTAVRNGKDYDIYLDSDEYATLIFEENSLSHDSATLPEKTDRRIDTVRLSCYLEDEETHARINNVLLTSFCLALDSMHTAETSENLITSMLSDMTVFPGIFPFGESYGICGELNYHLAIIGISLSDDGPTSGVMTLSASPIP